jgi:Integral membrane protein
MGFWPILPFAGLELLALGAALHACAQRGTDCEVISIHDSTVEVERGRRRPEWHYSFSRTWAHVVLERACSDWYPSRLLIRCKGREVEVGRFLNEQERIKLARELTQLIGSVAVV